MRPLLRPGTHPLRRADGSLQLGLDPARAVVLDPTPGLAAVLDGSATAPEDPEGPGDPAGVVGLLAAESMLVDERVLLPLVGGAGSRRRPLPRPSGAALAREAGDKAGERAVRRSRCRVETVRFGHPSASDLVEQLDTLVTASGISTPAHPVTAGGAAGTGGSARRRREPLMVLVGVGEPARELADPWLRDQVPHLVLRMTEGRAVVGPFVAPGRTACLRCLDAHHTDADPEWPLLLHQYADASSRDRADGVPEPVDPTLAALAVAWAARDLTTYADGLRPSTWSATVAIEASDLGAPQTLRWLRHPECACSWT